jgi:biopolymer transport protein ExbD
MRKRPDLNQSSDIAFLLILFFLVLASLQTAKALSLDLPSQQIESSSSNVESLHISLEADGTLMVNHSEISQAHLQRLLTSSSTVRLSVNPHTPWQCVVDLFSIIERNPPNAFSIEVSP